MLRVFSILDVWLVSSIILLGQSREPQHLYSGSGSVTRNKATTTVTNLFQRRIRVAALGTIKSSDNKVHIQTLKATEKHVALFKALRGKLSR